MALLPKKSKKSVDESKIESTTAKPVTRKDVLDKATKLIEDTMDKMVKNYSGGSLPGSVMHWVTEQMGIFLTMVGFKDKNSRLEIMSAQWRRVAKKFNMQINLPKGVTKIGRPGQQQNKVVRFDRNRRK